MAFCLAKGDIDQSIYRGWSGLVSSQTKQVCPTQLTPTHWLSPRSVEQKKTNSAGDRTREKIAELTYNSYSKQQCGLWVIRTSNSTMYFVKDRYAYNIIVITIKIMLLHSHSSFYDSLIY